MNVYVYDDMVVVEEFIVGIEFVIGMIMMFEGMCVLLVVEICFVGGVYDYLVMYIGGEI